MSWRKLPFGKYAGKTLPQIAFLDPDWLFWLIEQGQLYGRLAKEAAIVEHRATRIILKKRVAGSYHVDWVFDREGGFAYIEIIPAGPESRVAPRYGMRTNCIDLRLLRRHKAYDKGGYKRLMRQVRTILFPNEGRVAKTLCEAFFDDPSNFG